MITTLSKEIISLSKVLDKIKQNFPNEDISKELNIIKSMGNILFTYGDLSFDSDEGMIGILRAIETKKQIDKIKKSSK